MDVSLIKRAMRNDQAALWRIYETKWRETYYLARKIVGNEQEAADATQEAFLRAFRDIGSLKKPQAFDAWFYRIVVNTCNGALSKIIDTRKTESIEARTYDIIDEHVGFVPGDRMEQDASAEALMQAIDTLSEEQKTAVLLFYYQQLSYSDIAFITGIAPAGVESRLRRAKAAIKEKLAATVEDKTAIPAMLAAPVFMRAFAADAHKLVTPEAGTMLKAGIQTALGAAAGAVTAAGTATTATGAAAVAAQVGVGAKTVVCSAMALAIATTSAGFALKMSAVPRSEPVPLQVTVATSSGLAKTVTSIPAATVEATESVAETRTATPQELAAVPQQQTRTVNARSSRQQTQQTQRTPAAASIDTIEDMLGVSGAQWLAAFRQNPSLGRRGELQSFLSEKGFSMRAKQRSSDATYTLYTLEKQDKRITLIEKVPASSSGPYGISYRFGSTSEKLPESWELMFVY